MVSERDSCEHPKVNIPVFPVTFLTHTLHRNPTAEIIFLAKCTFLLT